MDVIEDPFVTKWGVYDFHPYPVYEGMGRNSIEPSFPAI
jgi:hypothetical protein